MIPKKRLNIELPHDLAIPLLGLVPPKLKAGNQINNIHLCLSTIIHVSQKVEIALTSLYGRRINHGTDTTREYHSAIKKQ